jgi:radical SAM superfamily enzyme YgiQ (UPF0313 family)
MGGFGQLYPVGATLFPPLDLVYLASYLADKNVPVEILECLALELTRDQLIEKIAALRAAENGQALLVFIRTSAPTLDWDMSIIGDIKAKTGNCVVGIYGPVVPHALNRIQKENCLDYIIKGDPDETVYALMTDREEKDSPGLIFRSQGEWIENPAQPFIKELDKLPFPKWEMLPFQKYTLPKSSTNSEMTFLPIWSSRGCPIGCDYCPYPVGQGLPWRSRSAQNVVDEIEHLVNDLGIQYILFRDPMFSLNQKRVIEICNEVERRGIRFNWRCETRVDFLKEETLRAMAKAGCNGINFGVESSDVEIQANVGRAPISQEQFMKSFALCRELGIKTFAFFIIGLPGDSIETVLKTIKFAIDMKPSWVQFTAASPFIGTKLRDWAITQGVVEEDDYAYTNSHEVLMGNGILSKEQVRSLYHFAKFVEKYLLNRKGILKEDNKQSRIYRIAKSVADTASDQVAHAIFPLAKLWFNRNQVQTARERTV